MSSEDKFKKLSARDLIELLNLVYRDVPAARRVIDMQISRLSDVGQPNWIDPRELTSMPQLAAKFEYNADHLRQLCVDGKITAWFIGGSWVTTRALFKEYLATKPRVGRPRKTPAE